jgi:cyclic pyranopterin phosphate synthase
MSKGKPFRHLSTGGKPIMVDVSAKGATRRSARAEAWVTVGAAIAGQLRRAGGLAKGDVLQTARLAGIMAAKRTAEIIPMCHPLTLDAIDVEAQLAGARVHIVSRVSCEGKTGVEMEAMVAAAVGALTVYDMVKSAGKGIAIGPVRLLDKSGGKSGKWVRVGGTNGQD